MSDESINKLVEDFFTSANISFVMGIVPVTLWLSGMDLYPKIVILSYWMLAIASPFIVSITLLRWLKKIPTPVTWLQLAYGVTAICTWVYSGFMLMAIYEMIEQVPEKVIALIFIFTLLAFYLSYKAYKNHFKV